MTRLNDITAEHLGDEATDRDLLQFTGWVRELVARDGLSESEAIDTLWNDGDYLRAAVRLGLATT